MKKLICVVLCSLLLVGCGGGSNVNEKTLELGKQALAIEESFQNGVIDSHTACEQLQEVWYDLNSLTIEDSSQSLKNLDAMIDINSYCVSLTANEDPIDSYNDLKYLLGV